LGVAAHDPLHAGALIAAGLLLFILTLAINGVARGLVIRAERRQGTRLPPPAVTAAALNDPEAATS
jgi:phosphate transport system permease protein